MRILSAVLGAAWLGCGAAWADQQVSVKEAPRPDDPRCQPTRDYLKAAGDDPDNAPPIPLSVDLKCTSGNDADTLFLLKASAAQALRRIAEQKK